MGGEWKGHPVGGAARRRRASPWSRYVESAVNFGAAVAPGEGPEYRSETDHRSGGRDRRAGTSTTTPQGYRERIARLAQQRTASRGAGGGNDAGRESPRRRTDVRLGFPAVLVWGACLAGLWLPPLVLALLCLGMAGLATALLVHLAGVARRSRRSAGRSFTATAALALLLAAVAAAHSAGSSSQRFDGPLAEAIASGKTAVAVVEVAAGPRALGTPGQAGPPARWSVPVWTHEVATGGALIRTRAQLVVTGSGAWGSVVPGQRLRATGKLRAADPGRVEAGALAASSPPGRATGGSGLEQAAKDLRTRFVAATAFLAPDAAGLLPGMVTGDTSALDEGLENAMKTVGMTHLTAVSGANCSLVLGALLLACRKFRLPRAPAAVAALCGLGLFVVLVGPDASVLRAALMGAVAVAALAGGRTGRGLSFLCTAVIGLLLLDPGLGGSFGFLLSVLATLGIIVLGRRMIDWTPATVPRWAAAAVAVPLSAQLLCGPVIVLLQPQFSTYSLAANVVAAPLVAPVTLLGTAAVPLVALAPWPATVLIAAAGTFTAGVAGTARFAAQLPGASLPWPEGVTGLLSMLLLSVVTFAAVVAAARPRRVVQLAVAAHGRTVALLVWLEGRERAFRYRYGFVRGPGRGRLEYSTTLSGRNPRWPLRKSEHPVRRRRIPLPGATPPRPPSSW